VKQHAADLLPGARRAADIDRQRHGGQQQNASSVTFTADVERLTQSCFKRFVTAVQFCW